MLEYCGKNLPVVVNCVPIRFAMIPCNPILALINAIHTNAKVFVQAISLLSFATLDSPSFQIARDAAMVNRACRSVADMSHMRDLGPSRSPIRPINAPAMNVKTDVRAS